MRRPWLIVALGLLLGAASFGVLYANRTAAARALSQSASPELAWIKQEFHLTDAAFAKVRELHEAYKPLCAERCRQLDERNRRLSVLLAASTNVTPEIEAVLTQMAQLRRECQTEMLRHFFAVSRAMPPAEGRRYLVWMQAQTLAPTHAAMLPQVPAAAPDEHAHHHH